MPPTVYDPNNPNKKSVSVEYFESLERERNQGFFSRLLSPLKNNKKSDTTPPQPLPSTDSPSVSGKFTPSPTNDDEIKE